MRLKKKDLNEAATKLNEGADLSDGFYKLLPINDLVVLRINVSNINTWQVAEDEENTLVSRNGEFDDLITQSLISKTKTDGDTSTEFEGEDQKYCDEHNYVATSCTNYDYDMDDEISSKIFYSLIDTDEDYLKGEVDIIDYDYDSYLDRPVYTCKLPADSAISGAPLEDFIKKELVTKLGVNEDCKVSIQLEDDIKLRFGRS